MMSFLENLKISTLLFRKASYMIKVFCKKPIVVISGEKAKRKWERSFNVIDNILVVEKGINFTIVLHKITC